MDMMTVPVPDTRIPRRAPMRLNRVSQVLAWFRRTNLRLYSKKALDEKARILSLFDERFGQEKLSCCIAADLLAFLDEQPGLTSAWSKRRWVSTITRPFNLAARLGLIQRNPFTGIYLPPGERGRDITDVEFRALLRVARPCFRRVLIFLRLSGARPNELYNLEWPHINVHAGAILLPKHKTRLTQKVPKPRRIALNRVLIRLLIWIRKHAAHETHVFINSKGTPYSLRALTKYTRELRRRAGLPDDVRLYGCRHAFATNAIIAGVDIATLAELMGHVQISTTTWYLHLSGQGKHLNAAMESAGRLTPYCPTSPEWRSEREQQNGTMIELGRLMQQPTRRRETPATRERSMKKDGLAVPVILETLHKEDPENYGLTHRRLRYAANIGGPRLRRVVRTLVASGLVEEVKRPVRIGSQAEIMATVVRRK